MDRGSWAGLPYQNLLFICELSSPLVFLPYTLGKSFIYMDSFLHPVRELSQSTTPILRPLRGDSFRRLWGKFGLRTWINSPRTSALKSTCLVLSSTYVDRGSGIRLRSFFSRRIRVFFIVICGCKSYRSARAAVPKVYCSPCAEGGGGLRRRGAAQGRRPHRPRHWSG